MMRFINLFQTLFDNVGINLGCCNIRVAQHHLHGAQIRSAIQQVRGKTVPQHVRTHTFLYARVLCRIIANVPDSFVAQVVAVFWGLTWK